MIPLTHAIGLGTALLLLGACGGPSSSEDNVAPSAGMTTRSGIDVVLITIDTLRADALGFAGNEHARTPILDRLAATGRVFSETHAHNVVTLPSHTNILTGLYPYQHGVRENSGFVLRDDVPTLATLLADAGYATGAFIGAYPLDSRFGLDRGFDVYDDTYTRGTDPRQPTFAERRGDEVVASATAWWAGVTDKPRFLWLHLYDPHAPYAPPEPFATDFAGRPYLGEVAAVDHFLAPLIEPLLAAGPDSALVVMTSDHGEGLGDHGELTHGLFAYEPTLKVPMVVWGIGVEAGTDDRSAAHVDIAPTILSTLGLSPPDGLPGHSLLAPPQDSAVYFEALSSYFNRGWAPLRGLIRDGGKMIDLPLPELYDLATDPDETDNRIDTERRRFRTLQAALPSEATWPPDQREIDPEEAASLRSLGYLAASPSRKTGFGPDDDPKRLRDVDRMYHQAIDAQNRGNFAAAETLTRAILDKRPDMANAATLLSTALRDQGRLGEAITILEGALEAAGGDRTIIIGHLASAFAAAGQPAKAIPLLEPFADDDDPSLLTTLGIVLSDVGRHRDGMATLQRVLDKEPSNTLALENAGVIQLRLQQPIVARGYLERALALNPNLPICWNTLGVAHAWTSEPRKAIEAWERAVALDPGQLDALFNLGLTAAQIGERDRARAALERYIASAPADRFAADIARAREVLRTLG